MKEIFITWFHEKIFHKKGMIFLQKCKKCLLGTIFLGKNCLTSTLRDFYKSSDRQSKKYLLFFVFLASLPINLVFRLDTAEIFQDELKFS